MVAALPEILRSEQSIYIQYCPPADGLQRTD